MCSQLHVYRIYTIVSRGLKVFFSSCRAAYIFPLAYQKVLVTPSLSLAAFCWPNPHFTLFFHSSASRAHPSQEGLWQTEDNCSGESSLTGLQIEHEACYTRKYLRGLGNVRWSPAYNQVNTVCTKSGLGLTCLTWHAVSSTMARERLGLGERWYFCLA